MTLTARFGTTLMKRTFVLSLLSCCMVRSTYRRSFFLTVCARRVRNCRRILQAAEKGHTESYIICPAAVVGPSRGPVRANSFFFKFMAQLALAFKKTFYVGEGENVFYTVRLDDLADLYKRVFAHILSREGAKASPYSKYYIAVSTPDTWKHITTTIGAVLARIGKLEDGTAHSVSISIVPPPASSFLGASQHVRGERAKDLGWEPRPVVLEDWVDEGITSAVATLQ